MNAFDGLRPPAVGDPSARAYKDWLHLNVFLPERETVVLINVSLHGPPWDRRARAVGVALAGRIGGDWLGGVEVRGVDEVGVDAQGVFMETVAVGITRDQRALSASVRRSEDGVSADITAVPAIRPSGIDLRAGFGSGWIGWSAMPVLELGGRLTLDGEEIGLAGAVGYHDHNWGRWLWGEDAAWEWGAFALSSQTVVVVARSCDKAHKLVEAPHVMLIRDARAHVFRPDRVEMALSGRWEPPDRRLPGALAAVHPDRRHPDLPARVTIRAEGAAASFELVFESGGAAQLILAEPTRPGAGFINELVGECRLSARIGSQVVREVGIGIFEYVE